MTIFARDADTGVAKWVYQMTPHDEWDYDGVNEMVLVDTCRSEPAAAKALVHMDRNGFGYTLNRENGELLVAREIRPGGELGDACGHGDRPAAGGQPVLAPAPRARTPTPRTSAPPRSAPRTSSLPPGRRRPSCSTCRPTMSAWTTSPSASRTPPVSPISARRCRCIRRRARTTWATSSPGKPGTGKIVWSKPERFSVWSGALATAGDVVFYGTLEGYLKAVDTKTGKELYQLQDPVRHHRQRQHLHPQGQAVRRRCCRASAAGPASAWRPA